MTRKKKNKKGKRCEISLPEAMIQLIQSFMSGKEAARSAILSKSWYNAWLTNPTIVLDRQDFGYRYQLFEEFAKKTMQRYQDSSLKIESFRLSFRGRGYHYTSDQHFSRNLIVDAIKMGATHLKLELPCSSFLLPQEVLGSKTLVQLSIYSGIFDENCVTNSCSTLKSLTLRDAKIRGDDVFKDLASCCISMEELSLSNCSGFELRRTNMCELHKLRRLFLYRVDVDNMFFTDFASRFPCLKDLTVYECNGCTSIHIAATSLQTIRFKPENGSESDSASRFDVPNIRKFIYSASSLPSHLSINGASSWKWDLDISIACSDFHESSWFMNLKKLLNKFRQSRISLFINLSFTCCRLTDCEHEFDVEEPIVVENLVIEAPPTFCSPLLVRSFRAFRPKFVTHRDWTKYPWMLDKVKSVRKRLIQLLFVSNWQEKFGQFGLKEVNMDICNEFDALWRPFQLKKSVADRKAKVRFQLIWED